MRALWVLALISCGGGRVRDTAREDLDARFPLAKLDDRALCDHLLARSAQDFTVARDAEPKLRRKVMPANCGSSVPGPRCKSLTIEDFYADTEWAAFLQRESAQGPTDIIIAGDFVEFWQIATVLGALPRPRDPAQLPAGPVLGADQAFSEQAIRRVIAAHPRVFDAIGRFLDGGDHRVVIVAGNHDADLLWPKVQRAIARAVAAKDPDKLVFVDAVSYLHGGVYIAHGHALDAANRFATQHAPFGRDATGRCRLQSNWGEVFVDLFYTETERRIPFIDNLYPENAAILWAIRDNSDLARDLGAAVRAVELLRIAQDRGLNRDALGHLLQGATGITGDRGPESPRDVIAHVGDRLTKGDRTAEALVDGLLGLATDPDLRQLRAGLTSAIAALPDIGAAMSALKTVDKAGLAKLKATLFGDSMDNAAADLLEQYDADVIVMGHTHAVGGFVKKLDDGGYYANTGSWISVASVAELRAKGLSFDDLALANRELFPSKMTAITIHYRDGEPQPPSVSPQR